MTFDELVQSRRKWIEEVLRPWCRRAARADLLAAEAQWTDLAGQVDPQETLWPWAWSRFEGLVHPELQRLDESREVTIVLRDGRRVRGFPDGRESRRDELVLFRIDPRTREHQRFGPLRIDQIELVVPAEAA
ncbi:MAG: hypothetical protein D6725_05840 [Planctomycetota bacterium]|nr:MAG: hypothetical protein D6725_05840 [Planctomycetota bacterium]